MTEMQQLPLAKLMFQIKDFHKGGPFRDNIELDKQTDLKRGRQSSPVVGDINGREVLKTE